MLKNRFVQASALFLCLGPPSVRAAGADDHVVSLPELERQIESRSKLRRAHAGEVEALLSNAHVRQALRTANLDPQRVRAAVSLLSDEELARLAARAGEVRAAIEGGALTNTQLTYVVIALVTALVVTIIFVA